ncbi:NAD(P)H-dependent oxidoreductase [Streptomyces roseirectus]|uniref:FMN dependent NADH:quinone oxidoreductase n=1 Tax=Streptomyces roseirectus TaxID=2768066 RepID=A0A7H0IPZ2_9ACTN|nr:NAD(P)H-dependent oxidoreductase [Streptomyces roseirectus]QNP68372.1 NAD(P)H-dependent oxidoreductase [Streptomyces roseirectus]QNP74858.1 NAD(P)H-dependent oxidoreductase [Streptomyces roseirectus]
MKLFRLDASIRTEGSMSRALADTAEQAWLTQHPHGTVIRRDLGVQPLPGDTWTLLAHEVVNPDAPAPREAHELLDRLGTELLEADAFLFAVPMYNWNVPEQVKTWIDLILKHPVAGVHGNWPLTGKPAILTLSRGGGYGPGTPKEGWDHATPYLRRILADVLGLDLHIAEAELTHAFWDPKMESLRELAEQSMKTGHEQAAEHGTRAAQLTGA